MRFLYRDAMGTWVKLGKTIEHTLTVTLQKIDTKPIKWRILAMTLPMDILHRATLINSAMISLYNHVLMAHPTTEDLASCY
jgi:hypothetical protein